MKESMFVCEQDENLQTKTDFAKVPTGVKKKEDIVRAHLSQEILLPTRWVFYVRKNFLQRTFLPFETYL